MSSSTTPQSRRRGSVPSLKGTRWSSRSSRDRRARPPRTSGRSDLDAPAAVLWKGRSARGGPFHVGSLEGAIEILDDPRLQVAPVVLAARQVALVREDQQVVPPLGRV